MFPESASFGAVCPTWGKTAGKLIVLNPDLPITNKPEGPSSINDCEESSTKSKNSAFDRSFGHFTQLRHQIGTTI
jgi:hypothetical protein